MRACALLFLVSVLMFSCSKNIETNSPAFQGTLDESLFIAIDARATENEDGTFLIQGVTDNEALTLKVSTAEVGSYALGGTSSNYATFENRDSNLYLTNPQGDGEVVISNWDTATGKLTGSFKFNAVYAGVDTLNVQRGLFFEVSYALENVDPDDGQTTNDGTFVARVNGNPFNPFTVSAIDSGNSIVVVGSTPATSITISVPIDITTGSYSLLETGFMARYVNASTDEEAISGTIIVIDHDPAMKNIKGTFSFETKTKSISLGQFNVTYH